MNLRVVRRRIPITLESPERIERVLQQFGYTEDTKGEWRDVPMVNEVK